MKLNKWTLGLAALGLVSLAPGLRAQGTSAPASIPLTTALSATTISGYVDTSMVWNPGTGNANPPPYAFSGGKQDGFNLDSADVKIAKTPDTGKWAAGYTLELQYGADTVTGDVPVRQAYVELMAPVGNGLDLQIGQWDNIIGYESNDGYKNPNFTRSYGYSLEPTTHTGVLASYKVADALSLEAGVANSLDTLGINGRNTSGRFGTTIESKKAYVSLLTLTAPDSWGSLGKSSLYVGFDFGPGNATEKGESHEVDKKHLYVGAAINTPVKGLTVGAAWDAVVHSDIEGAGNPEGYATAYDVYVSYKLTDKATINARGEYVLATSPGLTPFDPLLPAKAYPQNERILALTGTLQYQLWDNVITRLEGRWDNSANGYPQFGGPQGGAKINEVLVAANVIYKF
jgi:hypothetical protein